MRVDAYTKIVLTLIAICLVLLVFKAFEPIPATATNEMIRVDLARIGGTRVEESPYLFDDEKLGETIAEAMFRPPPLPSEIPSPPEIERPK